MSHDSRDKAVQEFETDPTKRVMLASLKSGGLGLNLTMASKVICLDPWWNNAVEQQAFCKPRTGPERRKNTDSDTQAESSALGKRRKQR